jgi:hypothetical protein
MTGPPGRRSSSTNERVIVTEYLRQFLTELPPVPQRVWRKPQWLKPELRVRVKHLAGGDTLRHASVKGLAGTAKEQARNRDGH